MRYITSAALLCIACPAFAQDVKPEDAPRDTVTVAAGVAVYPRFQGSRSSSVSPIGAVRGTVHGLGFSTLGTALFVDLVPSGRSHTKFVAGPVAQLELNRSSIKSLHDVPVTRLGKIKPAVELGGHIGVSRTGVVTSAYDNLTFDIAAVGDVSGVNDSFVVTPSINYGTPLSRKLFVGVSVAADYAGGGYARTYFGVTPAQQVASGLAAYAPGSGFKDVNAGALINASLTGDLRHGLAAFAIGNYTRLTDDIGRSPIVRDRDQLFGGIGLAYTF